MILIDNKIKTIRLLQIGLIKKALIAYAIFTTFDRHHLEQETGSSYV